MLRTVLGSWYNFCYTWAMKTAISIADPLFAEAEQFARENGLSRSELYARAIRYYLEAHRRHNVTTALDAVYGEDPNPIEPGILCAQSAAIQKENW